MRVQMRRALWERVVTGRAFWERAETGSAQTGRSFRERAHTGRVKREGRFGNGFKREGVKREWVLSGYTRQEGPTEPTPTSIPRQRTQQHRANPPPRAWRRGGGRAGNKAAQPPTIQARERPGQRTPRAAQRAEGVEDPVGKRLSHHDTTTERSHACHFKCGKSNLTEKETLAS